MNKNKKTLTISLIKGAWDFVSDKRLIIRNPSALGMREKVELIAYDKITAMELERGMMSSTLKIRASGYQGDIDAIDKEKAEKMSQYVNASFSRLMLLMVLLLDKDANE